MKVTTDACLFGAWVAHELRQVQLKKEQCLDIGTGTGLLSLMLAQKFSEISIDAVELNEDAAIQAKENTDAAPFKNRIQIHHDDIRVFHARTKYDVIISNPPFYEKEIVSQKPEKQIAHHSSGLLLYELFPVIRLNLAVDGRFFIMLPAKREKDLRNLLWEYELVAVKKVFAKQTDRHDPFRILVHGAHQASFKKESTREEIIITDERQQYTPDFFYLLKDYYLHL